MIAHTSKLLIALLLTFVTVPSIAKAEMVFGAISGYALGTLVRKGPEKFTAIPTQAFLGYNYWKLSFRGVFQHMPLTYTHDQEKLDGVYSTYGLELAYSGFISNLGKATVIMHAPLNGTLTLLSETTGQVNDFSYTQSTLVTMSGQNAMQILAGYEFNAFGRGILQRGGNVYYGLFLGYLKHTFSTQTTRIKGNSSVLAPISPGTQACSNTLTILNLSLSAIYDL